VAEPELVAPHTLRAVGVLVEVEMADTPGKWPLRGWQTQAVVAAARIIRVYPLVPMAAPAS
jgi:hypothetical protein